MKNTFELEHVGINTDNAGEAEQLALLLCKLFNLEPRHGQKSEFAGNYFECMKSPFLGKNGCDGGAGGKWLPLPHGDCRLF